MAAARLLDYVVASAEAVRIFQQYLGRDADATELLREARRALVAERAAHGELPRACVDEAFQRLDEAERSSPASAAERLHRRAEEAIELGRLERDRDRLTGALGLVRQAAALYREAWRLSTTRDWRSHLFDQEAACLNLARELRRELGVDEPCEDLRELATRLDEVALSARRDPSVLATVVILGRVNELEQTTCSADALVAGATSHEEGRRHIEAARLYTAAAELYRAALRDALASDGALARAAFPQALARGEWILGVTARALESYRRGALAHRDARGRATSAGRRLEIEANVMLDDVAHAPSLDAGTRRRLDAMKVEPVSRRRHQLLFPDGDLMVAGGVLVAIGLAGAVTGATYLYRLQRAQERSGCLDPEYETCDAGRLAEYLGGTSPEDAAATNHRWRDSGLAGSIGGGILAGAGSFLLLAGIARSTDVERRARQRRVLLAPTISHRILGASLQGAF